LAGGNEAREIKEPITIGYAGLIDWVIRRTDEIRKVSSAQRFVTAVD
jgi:hypothetical protein